MPALPTDLRNKLERTVIEARDVAEAGARAALEAVAVHHHEPYPHQTPAQRGLRNQLRAHARQLGDTQNPKGELQIDHIVQECAYEHWHRMLFARFLAENSLLIEPLSGVAISLEECEALAKEAKTDLWSYASRCAQGMLPQIFRPDDPLLQVSLAREHRGKLEQLLAGLPPAVFTADDALGWVYQFWQSKKKDEVNESGEKITSDTLPVVTQLFTEHYMVLFLLHNTIGAWYAGKVLAANPKLAASAESEEELRRAVALTAAGGYSFDYLRFVRGPDVKGGTWRPAAGTFDGWPKLAAELKVLDPCCGSGHFLIAGFELLVRLRMQEEGLSLDAAVTAVLCDNLYGLEIDQRCTQIAAFNLALAAWKLKRFGELPPLHIACAGIGPRSSLDEWLKLASRAIESLPRHARDPVRNGLINLHRLFSQAPTLGSLINPHELPSDMLAADYETLLPVLTEVLTGEQINDEAHERAVAAQGMVKAAELLAAEYTLVTTNVPYLGFRMQSDTLRSFVDESYSSAKSDLAIVFVVRSLGFLSKAGTLAVVTPQNWLFLARTSKLRARMLAERSWNLVARLGEHAFESAAAAGAFAAMVVLSEDSPASDWAMSGIDVSAPRGQRAIYSAEKAALLRGPAVGGMANGDGFTSNANGDKHGSVLILPQDEQAQNPDATIILARATSCGRLGDVASSLTGAHTLDVERFRMCMWEVSEFSGWNLHLSTPRGGPTYTGYSFISAVRYPGGPMHDLARRMKEEGYLGGWLSGNKAWGRLGVACSAMSELPATLYNGAVFDNMSSVIIPTRDEILPALWAYCSSPEFNTEVRKINQKLQVANATLEKIPFDLAHWQKIAAKKYPNGLPEPESDDPTQWLFHGRAEASTGPIQVAVARMMGYRWPAELDDKIQLSARARGLVKRCDELRKLADDDGIVCIPSVRGEEPATDRLLAMLTACGIKPDRDLDDWLRNEFFQEHCELFHHRPFIWHIWDGRKRDGFHALVNYHKLAEGNGKGKKLLESLTYSYLGEWINRQHDGVKRGEGGAEDRLAAALELQKRLAAILEGEPPHDLFIRWKPLHQQPIGWEPDINDGVRLNIRPFLTDDLPNGRAGAGILRWKPNIKWDKDRGKEPTRPKAEYPWFWGWDGQTTDFMGTGKEPDGNRWNDCHYTNATKRKARGTKG